MKKPRRHSAAPRPPAPRGFLVIKMSKLDQEAIGALAQCLGVSLRNFILSAVWAKVFEAQGIIGMDCVQANPTWRIRPTA